VRPESAGESKRGNVVNGVMPISGGAARKKGIAGFYLHTD
jgi:hypothetical protein